MERAVAQVEYRACVRGRASAIDGLVTFAVEDYGCEHRAVFNRRETSRVRLRRIGTVAAAVLALAGLMPGQQRHKVVVISLDAFAAESLRDPRIPAPTLRQMMKTGAPMR